MEELITTINNVAEGIKPIAPVVAGLVLIIIGILYMLAKDPQQKQMWTGWMINVGVGFAIVYLAASLVSWFSGKVSGF